jgi:hypothetical protein
MRRIEVLNNKAAAIGIKSADIEDGVLSGTYDDYVIYDAIGWDGNSVDLYVYADHKEPTDKEKFAAVKKICKESLEYYKEALQFSLWCAPLEDIKHCQKRIQAIKAWLKENK